MNFGKAIEALKQGKKVTRKGWNGKGMFLWLKPATVLKSDFVRDPILKQAVEDNGGTMNALGTICMKTADNQVLTGWLASQTDMLSEDWEIVGEVCKEKIIEFGENKMGDEVENIVKAIDTWGDKDKDNRSVILILSDAHLDKTHGQCVLDIRGKDENCAYSLFKVLGHESAKPFKEMLLHTLVMRKMADIGKL